MRNVHILADGAASVRGVYNYSPNGSSVEIHNSTITGTISLANIDDTSTEMMVGNSMLNGSVSGNNFTCVGVYNSSFAPLNSTCR